MKDRGLCRTDGVSVVIPFYGDPTETLPLIGMLKSQQGVEVQIIVSDDASPTPFPQVDGVTVTRREHNGGFGSAVNSGAALATSEFLLILNSDLEISDTFVRDLVRAAQPHMPCVAGCAMTDRAGHSTNSARKFPKVSHYAVEWFTPLARFRHTSIWERAVGHDVEAVPGVTKRTDWVVGAVMLMRTADFRAAGGFDERFFMNCEEVDLQWRLQEEGVPAVFCGDVSCLHEGGGSSDPALRIGWLMDGRFRLADKRGGRSARVRLALALKAVTYANFLVNCVRARRNAEVQPSRILNSQLKPLRGRMS